MESGFSRKSYAPSLVARTAVSMEPWPEIMTISGDFLRLLELLKHFQAIHAGQPDVEQHDVEAVLARSSSRPASPLSATLTL